MGEKQKVEELLVQLRGLSGEGGLQQSAKKQQFLVIWSIFLEVKNVSQIKVLLQNKFSSQYILDSGASAHVIGRQVEC
jgi:hypothetical protein